MIWQKAFAPYFMVPSWNLNSWSKGSHATGDRRFILLTDTGSDNILPKGSFVFLSGCVLCNTSFFFFPPRGNEELCPPVGGSGIPIFIPFIFSCCTYCHSCWYGNWFGSQVMDNWCVLRRWIGSSVLHIPSTCLVLQSKVCNLHVCFCRH